MTSKRLSRRELLKAGSLGLGMATMAACQPTVVKETVVVEKEVEKEVTRIVQAEREIEIWYWAGGGDYRANFYMNEVMPLFHEVHPNITVKIGEVGSWKDLYNKLLVGAAGGSVPEVCRQKDYYMPDFAERGVMQKLDDYVAAAPHLQDDDMWYPLAWENCHWKGEIHAMPPNIFIHYPHMSAKLFEEAGLLDDDGCPPDFDSWEELREAAAKLSDPDNMVFGAMVRSEGVSEDTTNWFHVMLAQAGGRLHDDGFTKFTFNDEAGLEALNYITGMIKDGIMKPVGVSVPNIQMSDHVGIWWHAANYWRTWPQDFPDFRWGSCINPMNKTRGAVLRSNHLALYADAREVEAGWDFISFHMRPEIDYMYGQSQYFITAQVGNWSKPFYEGGAGENACAVFRSEFAQLEEPGNQVQPIFPGYVEASFKIAARLQEAYLLDIEPAEALQVAEDEANDVLTATRESLGF